MGKYKVVMSGKTWPNAYEKLAEHCDIQMWEGEGKIPEETLRDWLRDADGFFNIGHITVDEELLEAAPNLRVISQSGVGYDSVDVEACTKKGVPFSNTPGVLVEATADLTFGLLLSAARRIHEGYEKVKQGNWETVFGVDLFGKTLGIVGMGDIGSAVARRAKASGMNIVYHNRSRKHEAEKELDTVYLSFEELLQTADCIVCLVPLSNESKGMFGEAEFKAMKNSAYFVNAARGGLVDTEALYEALKNEEIAYAALDVTDPEPLPADHKLLQLSNVLVTPHIGSATYETRNRMADLAVQNLLLGLEKKPLVTCVNEEVNYK
ncbi:MULTISPECIES: 2-hydroxyacid dehydrogenase [Priestia]|uniref:2-hydroxyacid dehydrogenase n=1 Tax=Priestia TaxID=2800373 RepID=UPI000BF65C8C|nr:D-glycerate dehydrogenase [Priestia aryabhattai]MCM3643933.1 D-glycerate dehydrogenase [Priestia aryabhattai]PFW76117.1 D-glycerate dehydrogenase [Priestia aryabhattai]